MGTSYYDALDGGEATVFIYSYSTNRHLEFIADIQSFSDNFAANVNSEATYGRIDAIKTYSGTTREISFSLKVESTTQDENFFKDIKAMAARMYGQYTNTQGNTPYILKSPPMFAIKIDPILVGGTSVKDRGNKSISKLLPGFITSFGITYDVTKGTETSGGGTVPREITLNFSFSPLHDRMGGFKEDSKSNTKGWPF